MLSKLSVRTSERGLRRLSEFLLALDCLLTGLGAADRRFRRDRKRRQNQPRAFVEVEFPQ